MTKSQVSYADKVKTIAAFRRRGDGAKTAVRTGFSKSYVSEVLSGTYRNEAIINAAFKVCNARKQAMLRRSSVS